MCALIVDQVTTGKIGIVGGCQLTHVILNCSICDYWLFSYLQRKVFHMSRPQTLQDLKTALIAAINEVNENNKDMIWKAMCNFLVCFC